MIFVVLPFSIKSYAFSFLELFMLAMHIAEAFPAKKIG